jgi:hypothetical protein
MKIGILVPSRERLNLKLTLISSIITTVNDINNVVLYFGIDDDDPTKEMVYKIAAAIPFIRIIPVHNEGQFIGINKIWNILAAECKEDIFGYIGDDMIFRTPNWDAEILKEFNELHCPKDNIKLVHCQDGYHGEKISINAFVHRKYYEVMGYFCYDKFLINYSDNWMTQMFDAFNRRIYRGDIFIQHNHWVFGGRQKDKTADRMLSDNRDKKSDKAWAESREQHIIDTLRLSEYLGIEANLSKIDK